MTNLQTQEVLEVTDFDTALDFHLRVRHYPPVGMMFGACKRAIKYCDRDDFYHNVRLPEGVTYKGKKLAPALKIVLSHHLQPFLKEGGVDCYE